MTLEADRTIKALLRLHAGSIKATIRALKTVLRLYYAGHASKCRIRGIGLGPPLVFGIIILLCHQFSFVKESATGQGSNATTGTFLSHIPK